jgi:hypothetical protein
LQGIESPLHRHLDIKRYNVWLQIQRFLNALPSIAGGADNNEARVGTNFSG